VAAKRLSHQPLGVLRTILIGVNIMDYDKEINKLKRALSSNITFFDIDWRISSTTHLLRTISVNIIEVERKINNEKETYIIEDGIEFIEELSGIAFVVAQSYITGAIADAKIVAMGSEKVNKEILLRDYSEKVNECNITKMELCDAMANYYKHHDEWHDWSKPGRHQKTVSILHAVGIHQFEEVIYDKVMGLLWPENDSSDLEPLIKMLSEWRVKVINGSKQLID
jgi:hypothetical protein